MKLQLRRKRISRSLGGDIFIFFILLVGAAFTALPLILNIMNAFKPLNEFFIFPPQFFVRNPTLNNFKDLVVMMSKSWVPISRYFYNSLLIVFGGVAGNVIFASLAAYAISKGKFPGAKIFFAMVVLSLMFAKEVTQVPTYIILSKLGWINTYWSIIIPAWQTTLGLFLMKKFIDSMIHDSLLEAARIDGAGEFRIFWQIVMPIVKPAWLTMIILNFQELWKVNQSKLFIFAEQLKPLPYALNQIISGGIARAGVAAAVTLIMMMIPITVFIINQSKIVETMGTSGID